MSTINGVGSKFYGKDEELEDGSYITTEWMCVLYIPLIPISSYRVKEGDKQNYLLSRSQKYLTQPIPLYKKQVRAVYLAYISVVIAIAITLTLIYFVVSFYSKPPTKESMIHSTEERLN